MDYILLYLLMGCFSGFVAGLFGVGGGMVIVPVLVFSFTATQPNHFDPFGYWHIIGNHYCYLDQCRMDTSSTRRGVVACRQKISHRLTHRLINWRTNRPCYSRSLRPIR